MELLVVIAIIFILARILLPALSKARQYSYVAVCASNLKQIGLAVRVYEVEGVRGISYINGDWLNPTAIDGGSSWNLGFRRTTSNQTSHVNSVFWCPMDTQQRLKAVTEKPDNWWVGSYGLNGCIGWRVNGGGANGARNNYFLKDVQNPSDVILAGENVDDHALINEARRPAGWCTCSSFGVYGLRHNGKGNVVFCDGHVELLTEAQTLSPNDLWVPLENPQRICLY